MAKHATYRLIGLEGGRGAFELQWDPEEGDATEEEAREVDRFLFDRLQAPGHGFVEQAWIAFCERLTEARLALSQKEIFLTILGPRNANQRLLAQMGEYVLLNGLRDVARYGTLGCIWHQSDSTLICRAERGAASIQFVPREGWLVYPWIGSGSYPDGMPEMHASQKTRTETEAKDMAEALARSRHRETEIMHGAKLGNENLLAPADYEEFSRRVKKDEYELLYASTSAGPFGHKTGQALFVWKGRVLWRIEGTGYSAQLLSLFETWVIERKAETREIERVRQHYQSVTA